MTILCPDRFYEAVRFALAADEALECAIVTEADKRRRDDLSRKRGQATQTLLACFASRANSDDIDTKNPYFPDGSEVHMMDGRIATVKSFGPSRLIRDTFIYNDFAPHSFFFREEWLDRDTRQRVEIYDKCWYVFRDGRTQDEADDIDWAALEPEMEASNGKIQRIFHEEEAKRLQDEGVPIRDAMQLRRGMCGGIIYHADYDGDERAAWGSWSTHT